MTHPPAKLYTPLNTSQHEIRLLRLKPPQHNLTLNQDPRVPICDLQHTRLTNPPPYLALSYVWDNACGPPQQVLLSGQWRSVSANLADALRQLRLEGGEDVLLWADQVCIDQSDEVEKAGQIRLMREIFQRAGKVVAWLGAEAEGSGVVFAALRQVERHCYRAKVVRTGFFADVCGELLGRGGSPPLDGARGGWDRGRVLDVLSRALPAFAERRYWTRLWVLQEYVLAGRLVIMCGSSSITDTVFRRAWEVLGRAANNHGGVIATLRIKADIRAIGEVWSQNSLWWDAWLGVTRFTSQRNEYHRLSEKLDNKLFMITYRTLTSFYGHGPMSCVDARDRVFSLLSMATDFDEYSHFPDYAKSTEEIYEDLAWGFLQQGYVDALSFCQEDPALETRRSMATWAADWSMKIRIPLWVKLPIDASQGWETALIPSILPEKTVTLSGICVGRIQSKGTRWSHSGPLTPHQTLTFLHQLKAFCDQSSRFDGDEAESICAQTAAPAAFPRQQDEELMLTHYRNILQLLTIIKDSPSEAEPEAAEVQFSSPYERELRLQLLRCPLITDNGYVGIAPPYIREGDTVCIFPGGRMPYILRREAGGDVFTVVGAAYMYGLMNGEYFQQSRREAQSFSLR